MGNGAIGLLSFAEIPAGESRDSLPKRNDFQLHAIDYRVQFAFHQHDLRLQLASGIWNPANAMSDVSRGRKRAEAHFF
jgi:hypothetical protein